MPHATDRSPLEVTMSLEEIGELIEHARQQHMDDAESRSMAFDTLALAVELLLRAMAQHLTPAPYVADR